MKIVLDSNVAVALGMTLPYSSHAHSQMDVWQKMDCELLVPTLWVYEVTTTIRKFVSMDFMSYQTGEKTLNLIFSLHIKQITPSDKQYQRVYHWANKLGQSQAYDAVYLALAESLHAEFWTADKRLYNRTQQLKLDWTYLIS
ncbi:MAG: hypothetical protein B6242_12115 [Anaerolineaceae bacterium 4572_78]|nr:MAG: hypothetical protein B6242_12115 [Anaerolineaceae bacterium 4572_78]